jgi:hypothetical protein
MYCLYIHVRRNYLTWSHLRGLNCSIWVHLLRCIKLTDHLQETKPVTRNELLLSWLRNSPHFMEPEIVLPCYNSQTLVLFWARAVQPISFYPISLRPNSVLSSCLCQCVPIDIFLSRFFTKIQHSFVLFALQVTQPAYRILYLITRYLGRNKCSGLYSSGPDRQAFAPLALAWILG